MADTMRFEDRMSDMDALMWRIEKDPMLRSTITAVAVLDSSPDQERLLDKIDRGTRVIPRLRQRVVGNPFSLAPPRWEVDPHFDLSYHVRRVTVPGAGTMRDLLDLAEPIAMQGFDRARPLWEFVIVDGLEGGRAALIQKIHHSITDGVGGVKMAMVLIDLEREPTSAEPPLPEAPAANVLGAIDRFRDGLAHVQRRQAGIARRLLGNALGAAQQAAGDPTAAVEGLRANASSVARMLAPATTPLSPVMTGRSLSVHFDTLTISLGELKSAAKVAGGKLNDAFVAGVLGGMTRYHDHHGTVPEFLRMTMPINIRSDETSDLAGNQFAPARFPVPLTIDDPADRMKAIRDLVTVQRGEPALGLAEPLALVLNRLPTTLTTAAFGSMLKGVDLVTSNVPGAPIPVFMAGAQVQSMFPFGPLSGAAANITLLSNLDDVDLGINTDRAAVPDPEVLLACLEDGFAEVTKLA